MAWRWGRPETLVLLGCVVAFGGNYGGLLYAILASPAASWAAPVGLAAAGLALSVAAALALVWRRARSARNFVLVGALASVVALLTPAGVVGGGVALAGAVWGLLATYRGVPDPARP